MKKADIILAGSILLFAVLLGILPHIRQISGKAELVISVDGKEFGRFDLHEDKVIRIGDSNVCEISGESVRMTEADCPDLLCVHSKAIGRDGGSIVCLPNKVVLKIEGKHENIPDTVAG